MGHPKVYSTSWALFGLLEAVYSLSLGRIRPFGTFEEPYFHSTGRIYPLKVDYSPSKSIVPDSNATMLATSKIKETYVRSKTNSKSCQILLINPRKNLLKSTPKRSQEKQITQRTKFFFYLKPN